jgi:hypothetical protein
MLTICYMLALYNHYIAKRNILYVLYNIEKNQLVNIFCKYVQCTQYFAERAIGIKY